MSKALFGVYPAQVTDVRDPDNQGRVKVRLPWLDKAVTGPYEAWARLATLMAGNGRGSWFVPDPGDEVLVAFEQGDTRAPYVIGSLWNGVDHPPERMDGAGANAVRVLRTRSGLQARLAAMLNAAQKEAFEKAAAAQIAAEQAVKDKKGKK